MATRVPTASLKRRGLHLHTALTLTRSPYFIRKKSFSTFRRNSEDVDIAPEYNSTHRSRPTSKLCLCRACKTSQRHWAASTRDLPKDIHHAGDSI